MFDRSAVFLDLETTGASASHDRVTEIGLLEVERGRLVREWSTLVNPETRIPPAIEALTGITNDMVRDAPTFAELARELLERLDGRLLVAHNARFDYGFLRNEFRRLGMRYQSRVLCTVKLSRRLYPDQHRHNLDSLIERHGILCSGRHRALGDARVLWEFVQKSRDEVGGARIEQALEELLRAPATPPGLAPEVLDDVPEGPGVYIFYGDNDIPLYVGKSVNLRSRVLGHFSADTRISKDMRLSQQVRRLDWVETVGELGALIQEARLVKKLAPVHNQRLRRNNDLCAWRFLPGGDSRPMLVSVHDFTPGALAHVYGVFRSKRDAINSLRGLAERHGLCPKRLGLESGRGVCFSHQIGKCRGVCAGRETEQMHDLRLAAGLTALRLRAWPFRGRVGVRETDAWSGRSELHVLDRWCYLGTVRSDNELFDVGELGAEPVFDLDTYNILNRWLGKNRGRADLLDLAGRSA
jgi:DNA polymerase-3 subunit epsilon